MKVFNALARKQLSAEGGYADEEDKCGIIFELPAIGNENQESKMRMIGAIPQGMVEMPGYAPEKLDGSITFRVCFYCITTDSMR